MKYREVLLQLRVNFGVLRSLHKERKDVKAWQGTLPTSQAGQYVCQETVQYQIAEAMLER